MLSLNVHQLGLELRLIRVVVLLLVNDFPLEIKDFLLHLPVGVGH